MQQPLTSPVVMEREGDTGQGQQSSREGMPHSFRLYNGAHLSTTNWQVVEQVVDCHNCASTAETSSWRCNAHTMSILKPFAVG